MQEPQLDQTIEFELVADGIGFGRIQVCAFHYGANIANLEFRRQKSSKARLILGAFMGERLEVLEFVVQRKNPDVSMYIFESGKNLKFYLQSADGKYQMTEYGSIEIHSPREYFQNYFRSIENLPLETTKDRKDAMDQLAEQGLELFVEALPEELQEFCGN